MQRPTRPTTASIDLSALSGNLSAIQKRVGDGVRVMAVVKANAYGHGIVPVSQYLQKTGWPILGVAFAEEGELLRQNGITIPIHVFALSDALQAEVCVRHALQPTVASIRDIEILQRQASRLRKHVDVHLKIDTGMNRIGARLNDLPNVLRALGRSHRLRVLGVYTHFATSDVPGSPFVTDQLNRFNLAVDILRGAGIEPDVVHAANSGAILHRRDAGFSMVRAGILMYGYSPSGPETARVRVRPVLRLSTRVALVKRISKGETVSYGRRFTARTATTIATIPIGYADGLFRSLTGKAEVLVHGHRRPVVGTICMDQCMVDCGKEDVRAGDEVVLIGTQGRQTLTAWDMAKAAGTIPYEITCAISARVPRTYHR